MATDRDTVDPAPLAVEAGGVWPLPWLDAWVPTLAAQARGHAVLLQASAGQGALQAAVTLAQTWLCEADQGPRPCGACGACRAVQGRAHPDLMLLMPEDMRRRHQWPLSGDKPEGGDSEDGGKSARKASRQLRIDEVRRAIDWVSTTSSRGRGKQLLLHPASTLNAHAASALLKTLEEPPAGVRLILTAADAQLLLPTIRSRCQLVRMPTVTAAMACSWLERNEVPAAADCLAASADQPLLALQWVRQGVDASSLRALPARLLAGDAGAFSPWPLPQALALLQRLCLDAAELALGRTKPRFDWPRAPARLDALLAWHRALLQAARHDEHPWNEGLLLESLVDQGRRALSAVSA